MESNLGNIFATQKDLMDHLAKYGTLTDSKIMEMSSTNGNVDAKQALMNTLERDLCKSAIDEIINKLNEL